MQAMLLAAGFGTRLKPYTLIRPKPLFPVLNRPLLLILLDMLRKAGCTQSVVNGHHFASQVEEAIAGQDDVHYQFEEEILGTGGSLRQALPRFSNDPILVMNGDIFHTVDIEALYNYHLLSGNRITMAIHDYPRFNTVGVRDGWVQTFRPAASRGQNEVLAFTGIHVVNPEIIQQIPASRFFHIIDLYEKLLENGEKIGCFRVDGSFWQDIGTVKDYLGLHGKLLSRSIMDLPPLLIPESPWLVSSKARLREDVTLSGWGTIGNAQIGRAVHLHNCVVWDNAVIQNGKRLKNKVITE